MSDMVKERCAEYVPEPPHYLHRHRCTRAAGYGLSGAYCKQHAKARGERDALLLREGFASRPEHA